MLGHGVNCSPSSNNVLNPFGDCSMIRMANLYANVCHAAVAELAPPLYGFKRWRMTFKREPAQLLAPQ